MARTSRNLAVSVIVAVGLAGVARTACARQTDPSEVTPQVQNTGFGCAGLESDLYRHAHRDEYRELLEPTAQGDRSHRDLRRVQRHRTTLHANVRPRQRPRRRVTASCVIAAATRRWSACSGPNSGLDDSYKTSLATLSGRCEDRRKSRGQGRSCTQRIERGVAWGIEVAQAVLAWRATDGFTGSYAAFNGGTVIGQWRPTPRLVPPPPTCGSMSAQGLAFTSMFVLVSGIQFQPGPPRGLTTSTLFG